MTEIYAKLLADHLKKAERELSQAWKSIQNAHKIDPKAVDLILGNWDEFEGLTPISAFRGLAYQLPNTEDVSDLLSWISWFIEHEIHDDGSPQVLWAYQEPRPRDLSPEERSLALRNPSWKATSPEEATNCFILRDQHLSEKTSPLHADTLEAALVFKRAKDEALQERISRYYVATGRVWVQPTRSKEDLLLKQILQDLKS